MSDFAERAEKLRALQREIAVAKEELAKEERVIQALQQEIIAEGEARTARISEQLRKFIAGFHIPGVHSRHFAIVDDEKLPKLIEHKAESAMILTNVRLDLGSDPIIHLTPYFVYSYDGQTRLGDDWCVIPHETHMVLVRKIRESDPPMVIRKLRYKHHIWTMVDQTQYIETGLTKLVLRKDPGDGVILLAHHLYRVHQGLSKGYNATVHYKSLVLQFPNGLFFRDKQYEVFDAYLTFDTAVGRYVLTFDKNAIHLTHSEAWTLILGE